MDNHSKPTNESTRQDSPLPLSQSFRIQWQYLQDEAQNDKTHAKRVFQEFLQLVESKYRQHHSPKFYADKLCMSRSNLRKICKQTSGFTPSHCICIRLMLDAYGLLNDPHRTIKEIAIELGFEDQKYFSKFFKKKSGLSPDSYRRLVLEAN